MSLSKSGSNSSTQTGYRLATNTWLRKHPSPMMDVYRKNAFSARPWRWYPDACFQRRRPSCFTHVIVRSRAGDHGPWPEAFAVLADGMTTVVGG